MAPSNLAENNIGQYLLDPLLVGYALISASIGLVDLSPFYPCERITMGCTGASVVSFFVCLQVVRRRPVNPTVILRVGVEVPD